MVALGISIFSPVDLLPGGEIDVRRVRLLGIHDGETLSEFPGFDGLDELTSARVLGRLLNAVAGASSKPSSRTLWNTPSPRSDVLPTREHEPGCKPTFALLYRPFSNRFVTRPIGGA